jgi:hypothetical protein
MKKMNKQIVDFCLKLAVALSIIFGIHIAILFFLKIYIFGNLMIPSYFVNYFLAAAIYILLIKLKKKYSHLLGFVFMIGSFLKFLVFFIFFYPIFKLDGTITTVETTSFLVPYFSCLIVETYYLIKLLNRED